MKSDLHAAIRAGDKIRVQDLLWQGADPSEKIDGRNAYHAAATSTTEIMATLLAHQKKAAVLEFCKWSDKEADPLRLAIRAADVDMVKLLLDFGVPVNNRDGDDETPLHFAIAQRKSRGEELPVLRLLLERGADVDAKAANYWDETPLFTAVRGSYTEAVRLLLDQGADATRINHLGESLLHLNAATWDDKTARMLVEAGAPLTAKDRTGRSALHIAAHYNKLDVVKVLLAAGADPFAEDNKRQIPSELCHGDFQKNTRRELLHKEMELEAIRVYGPHDKYVKREGQNRPSQSRPFRR
ncbi:MAG: ankyrin repeat domain-containing protein [Alphaproteobacteria bacterium]